MIWIFFKILTLHGKFLPFLFPFPFLSVPTFAIKIVALQASLHSLPPFSESPSAGISENVECLYLPSFELVQ